MASDQNFRDLAGISASNGGTGFADATANNGVMRTGVFYRSEMLAGLNGTDQTTLSSLHIGRDIDLRTPTEYFANPDVPFGATVTHINLVGTLNVSPAPPFTAAPAAAISYMEGMYQAFVTDPVQRSALQTVLTTLAHDPNADLFHCSGGKDRTGWTAAVLQNIAGVAPATIMKDYLATNSYTATFIQNSLNTIMATVPGANAATATALLGVQSSYLQAGLDQVAASYGSMNAYLTQGLGLTQADIYVLRAKMVNYLTLPGQSGFVGNAARGAAFLNTLQNSPLSGNYTAFNYYLQSAIDAGNLGNIPAQVGGQVHADAAAYLLRQPLWIDDAIAPYAGSRELAPGQTRIWMAGLGGGFWSTGQAGVASSSEYGAGSIIGATYRINERASADLGFGYNWGAVASAGGSVNADTVLATIGGRFALASLDAGPFVAARANVGWVDYHSRRALDENLGTATGSTTGIVDSARADVGDVIRLAPFTITLQTGVRFAQVSLGGFNESNTELALNVNDLNASSANLLADLNVSLDARKVGAWTIAPDAGLGYERALRNPQIVSNATLYGFGVSQYSAFDGRDLVKASLGIAAQRNALSLKGRINAVIGDGAGSAGVSGQLTIGYSF